MERKIEEIVLRNLRFFYHFMFSNMELEIEDL